MAGSTSFNGQRCTAIKLIMVHSSVAPSFNEKFCAAVAELSVGLPFGKNSVTPLACSSTDFMKQLTEDAKAKGAKVINAATGGGHCDRTLFSPAVLYPVTKEMQLWTAEQFGPVVPIAPFESLETPIQWLREMLDGLTANRILLGSFVGYIEIS